MGASTVAVYVAKKSYFNPEPKITQLSSRQNSTNFAAPIKSSVPKEQSKTPGVSLETNSPLASLAHRFDSLASAEEFNSPAQAESNSNVYDSSTANSVASADMARPYYNNATTVRSGVVPSSSTAVRSPAAIGTSLGGGTASAAGVAANAENVPSLFNGATPTGTVTAVAANASSVGFVDGGSGATMGAPVITISTGNNQIGATGSTLPIALTVLVKSSLGAVASGAQIDWAISTGGGTLSQTTSTVNISGTTAVNFTLPVSVGTETITATVHGTTATASFTESSQAGTATQIVITSGNHQTALAGGSLPLPLQVTVTDANNNPVNSAVLDWTVTSGTGILSTASSSSSALGVATDSYSLGATAGANTVVATIHGISTSVTFTETGTVGTAGVITINSGNNQSGTAGSALASPFQVLVKDSNGNVINGSTIDWVVTAGGGSLSAASSTTNSSGIAADTLTLGTTAGTNTVTATIHGTAASVTFTATGTAGAASTITINSGNGQSGVLASTLPTNMVVLVKDSNNNVIQNATIDWAISAGGGSFGLSSDNTNASGLASNAMTLGTVAGLNSGTATVHGTGLFVTFTATAIPGAPASIAINAGNSQSGIAGSALTNPLQVIVKDSYSNVIASQQIDWAVTVGGGSLTSASSSTNAGGIAANSLTLGTTVGTNTVTATVHGTSYVATFTETGTVGTASSITISSGNNQSGTSGTALPSNLVVLVKDSNGNVITNSTVDWTILTGGGSVSLPQSLTNASGLASDTFTLGTVMGSNTIKATLDGTSTSVTFTETGTAGAATSIAISSGNTQSGTRGTALAAPFVAIVKDTNGNVVTGATINWAVTAGGGTLSSASGTTNASGLISSTLTLGPGGTANTVTATINGTSTLVTFTATPTAVGFTNTWTFTSSTTGNYNYNTTKIDFTGNVSELTPIPHVDQDDTANGFGGGTLLGVVWDPTYSILRLDESVIASNELSVLWTPHYASLAGYWKMNNDWTDATGQNPGIAEGASFVSPGKLGTAAGTFDGSTTYMTTTNAVNDPEVFTISAWIQTTTTNGGEIVGFGNSQTGSSGDYDRHLYMLNDGSISFGVYPGGCVVLNSSLAYNDGSWHYIVATIGSEGMALYVDSVQVATNPNSQSQVYTGYWRVGEENVVGWPGTMNSNFFLGNIDDVAIWNVALSASDVQTIYMRQTGAINHNGTFVSRVMNAGALNQVWSSLNWKATLPFKKSLPDNGVSELTANYASQSASLMTGILGLWHFEEVAGTSGSNSVNDRSGTNNNGTPVGAPTFGVNGELGNAVSLSGGGQYVTLQNNIALTGDFTISAWVNLNSLTGSSGDGASNSILGAGTGNGDLNFYNGYLRLFNGSGDATVSNIAATVGVWDLWTFVRNGGTLSIYHNGTFNASQSYAGTFNVNMIGAGARGLTNTFAGSLDEVAIWNRALTDGTGSTPNETLELYRRGANRIKYQVRSCTDATCSSGSPAWLGPDATGATYFSELYNTVSNVLGGLVQSGLPAMTFADFSGLTVANNQYFQYSATLESDDFSTSCSYGSGNVWCSPELQKVSASPTHFDPSPQLIQATTGYTYLTLTSFTETLGSGGCSVGTLYDISKDGSTWYYWNGSHWSAADGTVAKANSAAVINTNISTFPTQIGTGTLYFQSFQQTDGSHACQIGSITVTGTN